MSGCLTMIVVGIIVVAVGVFAFWQLDIGSSSEILVDLFCEDGETLLRESRDESAYFYCVDADGIRDDISWEVALLAIASLAICVMLCIPFAIAAAQLRSDEASAGNADIVDAEMN